MYRWSVVEISKPGPYYIYVLNRGNDTVHVKLNYGLGAYQEEKPYAVYGLLLIVLSVFSLLGSIVYAVIKQKHR